MKKVFLVLACAGFMVTATTSCGKQCKCTEKKSDGTIVREFEEKQEKLLGVKIPCSSYDTYSGDNTITCR